MSNVGCLVSLFVTLAEELACLKEPGIMGAEPFTSIIPKRQSGNARLPVTDSRCDLPLFQPAAVVDEKPGSREALHGAGAFFAPESPGVVVHPFQRTQ